MSKTSKGKKIAIGLVVGVLATTAIVCATVPQVRESIKDLISKIKGEQTPEEKEKQDKEKAQEKAHDDDHYQNLTDDEKKDFDKKLDDIVDSDHYKNLDDEEKDKLLDKFVESEKVQQEIKNDKPDKKPAEIQTKIEDKQTELENVQKEIEDLKNSGASEEEIVKAEEKQQQVEEQIKSAEQEKAYWETVETVKESVSINENFSTRNPELKIRRVNGVYMYEGTAYINADFIKEEVIDGKSYYSKLNQFCRINDIVTGEENYEEILKIISGDVIIDVDRTCINKNSQEQRDYFEKNKSSMDSIFDILENNDYSLSIIESWQTTTSEYPEFIINAKSENDEMMYMATYSPELARYRVQPIQKICPEFWAQLEIERSQTATTSAEAKAQAIIDSFSSLDENGEEVLDYPAFKQFDQQQQAEKEAKLALEEELPEIKLTYSEQELGF